MIFVGAIMFTFVLLTGDWRRWREFRLFSGTLLFLLIAAPWHLLAGYRNKGFFWFYFVNEHFLRFLGRRYPKDYSKLPAYLYWTLHLAWLFPWSMYFPLVLKDSWQKLRSKVAVARFDARSRLLFWLWSGIILVFFAFSTNQEYYTFPAYFPLIVLLAVAVSSSEVGEAGRQAFGVANWSHCFSGGCLGDFRMPVGSRAVEFASSAVRSGYRYRVGET